MRIRQFLYGRLSLVAFAFFMLSVFGMFYSCVTKTFSFSFFAFQLLCGTVSFLIFLAANERVCFVTGEAHLLEDDLQKSKKEFLFFTSCDRAVRAIREYYPEDADEIIKNIGIELK